MTDSTQWSRFEILGAYDKTANKNKRVSLLENFVLQLPSKVWDGIKMVYHGTDQNEVLNWVSKVSNCVPIIESPSHQTIHVIFAGIRR